MQRCYRWPLASKVAAAIPPTTPSRDDGKVPDAPKASVDEIKALAQADDQLAARIFPQLLSEADANANIVISPVSLSQAIGMTYIWVQAAKPRPR